MRDALDPQVIPANSSVKVAANAKVSVSSPETQSELSGRLQQSTTASVKKSDLLALAKTMISNSFPALSGMRLKVKIVDTEDYVMSVSLESEEIHLDVSREDAARMGRSVTAEVLPTSFAMLKRIAGTVRFSKLCSLGFTSAFRGWKPGWNGALIQR